MKKKLPTYSRKQCNYNPPTNKKIVSLREKYKKTQNKLTNLANEIKKIQEECEHTYFFTTSGPYEDFYECSKCWHETEI